MVRVFSLFVLLIFCCFAFAEPPREDLNLKLNRRVADGWADKNYDFTVLEDMTVRRVWDLPDRRITIDFDPENDRLILLELRYKKPQKFKEVKKDAQMLAARKDVKLTPTKTKECKKIGLGRSVYMKLGKYKYLFCEANQNKLVTRYVLFGHLPVFDRFTLSDASKEESSSPLGSTGDPGLVLSLYRDEHQRKGVKPLPKVEDDFVIELDTDSPQASKPVKKSDQQSEKINPPKKEASSFKLEDYTEIIVISLSAVLLLFAYFVFGSRKKKKLGKKGHKKRKY